MYNFNSSMKYLYLQVNISLVCILKLIRFAERHIDHCICNMNFGLNTSLYTKHTAMNWMDVAIHDLGYNNILKTKNSVKRYRRILYCDFSLLDTFVIVCSPKIHIFTNYVSFFVDHLDSLINSTCRKQRKYYELSKHNTWYRLFRKN